MHIRPSQFTSNPIGSPAVSYEYHIGQPDTDPTIDSNKLHIKDGVDGSQTSNPLIVGTDGFFRNENGQRVNPWIDESAYSIRIISSSGGENYQEARMSADTINPSGSQDGVVNKTFNHLALAIEADLTAFDTIYVQSLNPGWESTIDGPIDGAYYHKDGTTGTPSTGNVNLFFDSAGDGWRQDDSQRIGEDDVTEDMIQDDAVTTDKVEDDAVTRDKIDIPVGFPVSIATLTGPGGGIFNTPAGSKGIKVTVKGAGGGGAGTRNAGATAAGAGGEGATAIIYITNPALSYSYVIGAGGTAGPAGGDGGDGQNTTFGVTLADAGGGKGGESALDAQPGEGGVATNGDILIHGATGGTSGFVSTAIATLIVAPGGGTGGGTLFTAAVPDSGAGGASAGGLVGANTAGYAGADGYIIVESF